MKKVLKAYMCTFPNLYGIDCADSAWVDEELHEIIYGQNQKSAVTERCKNDEHYNYWELKREIRTRKIPSKDLYLSDKSPLLRDLSDKHISHLTHSLGVSEGDVCPESFYRNYSMYYTKNEDCEKLVELGLMENWQKMGSEIYSVTELGKTAIKTLLLNSEKELNDRL